VVKRKDFNATLKQLTDGFERMCSGNRFSDGAATVNERMAKRISPQSGRFWATVIASFRDRLLDFRSWWIVFIRVVRGRPGCLLQFSKEGSCLDLLGICFVWHSHNVAEQGEMPCLDTSSKVWLPSCPSHLIVIPLIPNSFRKHHWSRASILNTSVLVTAQHSEEDRYDASII